MLVLHRFLLVALPCLAAVSIVQGQQMMSTSSVLPSTTMKRNLITTWDGITPVPPHKLIPLVFSLEAKTPDAVVVTFNSSSFTTDDDKFVTPIVFGVMFEGDDHVHLQVEVQRSGMTKVELYDKEKMLEPKEQLQVTYQIIPSINNTWNSSISIPASYFPRATKRIAAYANFTKSPHDILVFSLRQVQSKDIIHEPLPNLHKSEFFEDIEMHKYVPVVDFSLWSGMWQHLLEITSGGTHLPSDGTSTNKHSSPNAAASFSHSAFAIIVTLLLVV